MPGSRWYPAITVAYIFGDFLTEVYGYSRARRAIWIGFSCNLIAVIAIWLAVCNRRLPSGPLTYDTVEEAQRAYDAILGFAPRLLAAAFLAYLVGEFLNSDVFARMKIWNEGKLPVNSL